MSKEKKRSGFDLEGVIIGDDSEIHPGKRFTIALSDFRSFYFTPVRYKSYDINVEGNIWTYHISENQKLSLEIFLKEMVSWLSETEI